MFSAVLLSTGADRSRILKGIALATGRLDLLRQTERLPEDTGLRRMVNTIEADVWLVDFDDPPLAAACARAIQATYPSAAVIGISKDAGPLELPEGLALAATVPYPPEVESLALAVGEALRRVRGDIIEGLFVFLPAKAGSGASTVALNTAVAMAERLKKSVLLIDADLRSGVLAMMLNLKPENSIQSVLRGIYELDAFRWENSVVKTHGIDLLASSGSPVFPLPEWDEYFLLLDFVRSRYAAVVVDLPELVNPATAEIVRRAKLVALVTTPEILSLKLARQRCAELAGWRLEPERLRVVLNRWRDSEIAPHDVESHLQHPVVKVIPNDYRPVREAILTGKRVAPETRLGQAYAEFASEMLGLGPAASAHSLANRFRGLLRGL